ncbi:MAG: hypothetical protein AAB472_02145 [Patescibacteria group bacterium]
MGLFNFKKTKSTVAVVDVRSSSIGAAYVLVEEGVVPVMVHYVRFPLEPHATEPFEETFTRTMDGVLSALIERGGPLLRNATGSGSVDSVRVSCTTPWSSSYVRSEVIEKDVPFIYSRALGDKTDEQKLPDMKQVSEMVIATLLNGYEITNPVGKKAKRAESFVLSSFIRTDLMDLLRKKIRKAFHQGDIEFDAFMPELYAVTRDLYPHQRDFLVLDVGNEATDILLVKHGLLVSITSLPHGIAEILRAARGAGLSSPTVPLAGPSSMIDSARNSAFATSVADAQAIWIGQMKSSLLAIAKLEPLPRTVLLLADENNREFLRRLLDAPELRSLWLSDESLGVLPILPAQFAPFVELPPQVVGDASLSLLALAAAKRFRG